MDRHFTLTLTLALCITAGNANAQASLAGADEKTPSHSEYFTWINHSFEGPDETTVMAGLNFFKYLQDTYGMQLDIFAIDAGAIDGWKFYDSIDSPRVRSHFPNGFAPIARFSKENGMKLGMWCGPDGFGDTDEDARKRVDMMLSLVNDCNVGLFKMDGKYVGCPDRAPSYPSNTFECNVRRSDSNYTYYVPLTPDMKGKKIEAWVLTMWNNPEGMSISPEIWMSNYPNPFCTKTVEF